MVSYGKAVKVSVAVTILGRRMHSLLTQAYAPKLKGRKEEYLKFVKSNRKSTRHPITTIASILY